MKSILVEEYVNLFPEKNRLLFLRSLLCYSRMVSFRIVVLIRFLLKSENDFVRELICKKLQVKYGVEVRHGCKIGANLRIEHSNGIVIGGGVEIGDNCTIYQQVTLGQNDNRYPRIGNNVTLYPGCKIFGDIEIGDNVVVGANSVVTHNIPDNSIAAGVPARVIKSIKDV